MILFRNLGKALRRLRERRGYSQKQAAERAGLTPPMLSAYENDRTSPEIESLDKLLAGLDASLSDLEWALQEVGRPRAGKADSTEPGSGDLRADIGSVLDELTAEGHPTVRPLPAPLREGYAEILRGLVRLNRFVAESVVLSEAADSGEMPNGGVERG